MVRSPALERAATAIANSATSLNARRATEKSFILAPPLPGEQSDFSSHRARTASASTSHVFRDRAGSSDPSFPPGSRTGSGRKPTLWRARPNGGMAAGSQVSDGYFLSNVAVIRVLPRLAENKGLHRFVAVPTTRQLGLAVRTPAGGGDTTTEHAEAPSLYQSGAATLTVGTLQICKASDISRINVRKAGGKADVSSSPEACRRSRSPVQHPVIVVKGRHVPRDARRHSATLRSSPSESLKPATTKVTTSSQKPSW